MSVVVNGAIFLDLFLNRFAFDLIVFFAILTSEQDSTLALAIGPGKQVVGVMSSHYYSL